MKIDIKIEDEKLLGALNRLIEAGEDLSPAMRGLAGVLADATERAFQGERDPTTGTPWDLLKQATVRERERKGYWPGKILQRRGALAGWLVPEYGRDYAALVTNVRYAATHQFGDPARNIPARPFLGISEDDRGEIFAILRDHVEAAWRG